MQNCLTVLNARVKASSQSNNNQTTTTKQPNNQTTTTKQQQPNNNSNNQFTSNQLDSLPSSPITELSFSSQSKHQPDSSIISLPNSAGPTVSADPLPPNTNKAHHKIQDDSDPPHCASHFGIRAFTEKPLCKLSIHSKASCHVHKSLAKIMHCEFQNVVLNPHLISISGGGEEIDQVLGRGEEKEFPVYSRGAFSVKCAAEPAHIMFPNHLLMMYQSIEFDGDIQV